MKTEKEIRKYNQLVKKQMFLLINFHFILLDLLD